jgi:hypothetical protein
MGAPPPVDRRRGSGRRGHHLARRDAASVVRCRRLSLLPRDSRVIRSFRTFLARFGSLDQLYVVFTAPEGHAISEYADEIAVWADRLRAAPEIARVDAGVVDRTRNFGWLADHQLLVLHGRLLDEALRRLSPDGMPTAVAARRDLLTGSVD